MVPVFLIFIYHLGKMLYEWSVPLNHSTIPSDCGWSAVVLVLLIFNSLHISENRFGKIMRTEWKFKLNKVDKCLEKIYRGVVFRILGTYLKKILVIEEFTYSFILQLLRPDKKIL